MAPMMASVANVPLSSSDSNHRSRMGERRGEDFGALRPGPGQSPGTASQLKKRPKIPQAGSNQIGRRHRERGLMRSATRSSMAHILGKPRRRAG